MFILFLICISILKYLFEDDVSNPLIKSLKSHPMIFNPFIKDQKFEISSCKFHYLSFVKVSIYKDNEILDLLTQTFMVTLGLI